MEKKPRLTSIIFVPISWNQMNFDSATMAASVTFYLKNIKLFSVSFSDLFTYIYPIWWQICHFLSVCFNDSNSNFCNFEEEERSLNFWTILYEIGHSGLLDYFRRHLNAFIIYSHNLNDPGFWAYKTLPVAIRTHNHEDHTFFNFCNFSCKFYFNSYSSKDQKVSSISSKLCTRFAEPKFQLSIWRLWKYWWATTNSRRPCIQLWFRI